MYIDMSASKEEARKNRKKKERGTYHVNYGAASDTAHRLLKDQQKELLVHTHIRKKEKTHTHTHTQLVVDVWRCGRGGVKP
jgi:hypothetical protein